MFKNSTLVLILVGLFFCPSASAWENPEKKQLKRTLVAYKYHIMADDSEKAKAFPQEGHSVQLGHNFCLGGVCDLLFLTFVFDYTHLRQYRDPHVFSAGFDISLHPGKVVAKLRGRPYTPRMDKWLLTMGSYKTLGKYHLNFISSFDLSYRVRLGKIDLFPTLGFPSFDETHILSGPKPGEHYMDFVSFGLTARFY